MINDLAVIRTVELMNLSNVIAVDVESHGSIRQSRISHSLLRSERNSARRLRGSVQFFNF